MSMGRVFVGNEVLTRGGGRLEQSEFGVVYVCQKKLINLKFFFNLER